MTNKTNITGGNIWTPQNVTKQQKQANLYYTLQLALIITTVTTIIAGVLFGPNLIKEIATQPHTTQPHTTTK